MKNKDNYKVFTKKILVVTILIMTKISSVFSQTQLGKYEFTDIFNGCNSVDVTSQPSHATFSSFTSTNTTCGLIAYKFDRYSWNTSGTISTTEYNQFTITPSSGYQMTLNSLIFTQYVSFNNSTSWILRSSLDNYASDFATGSATTSAQTPTVTLSSSFQNLTSSVTFRFYIINANSSLTHWTQDDVSLNGTISVACTNPSAPGNPTSNNPQCADVGVTLTKSGSPPSGVTWYWQGTNSAGTSTTNNATSTYNASATGTYYIRAQDNAGGCWSATSGSVAVTVNPSPTITLGSNPTICAGTTTAGLTYSGTTNSPDKYSIDYNATAESVGFIDVTNASLPSSPITLTISANTATGTYNYTVTVKNNTTGCISSATAKSITINSPSTVTPGGPDQAIQSATPSAITLNGASVGGEATTGAWYIVSGGGTLSSSSQTSTPQSITYTPAANYSGTAILSLTTNSVVCSSATGNRTINIDPATSQSYVTAGTYTYTVPSYVTSVIAEVWGAGGGGGGNSQLEDGGGGGGGGAYSKSTLSVTPGLTYSLSVGAGGAGGSVLPSDGNNGGDTWFINNTTILAKGGSKGLKESGGIGGVGGAGGQASAGIGTTKYSGGNGAQGLNSSIGVGGGGGSSAGNSADGNNASTTTSSGGIGGTAPSGGGNGGNDYYYVPGGNGSSPGGGGAGASILFVGAGGNGAPGKVTISWTSALSISSNSVSPTSICQGTTNIPIHSIVLQGNNTGLTGFNFTTNGNYAATEVSNFKLYYTTTNAFSTSNLLATITSPTVAGTQTFPSFTQNIVTGTNYYLWITMDISSSVIDGHTIAVSGTSPNNITASSTPTGSADASGTKTIKANASINLSSAQGTNNQAICSGVSITDITYSITGGGSGATVTGLPTGVTGNYSNNTLTISGSPSVTGIYNYTATTTGICLQTAATGTIAINALPNISVNNATICAGQTATLTASGGSTYLWSNNQTTSLITVSPTTNTSYSVSGANSTGCSASTIAIVIVNPLPNIIVNNATICAGQTATITASGATNYYWNTGETTNSVTKSPIVNTNFTVAGTDNNNCTTSAISTVTVNSLPNLTVTSATICAGQTATLTASGATSYSWNTGEMTESISKSPASTTNFTVTGTSNGCSTVATSAIIVNSLPIVSVNSATICAGQTATLTAIGATNYIWNTAETSSSITKSPTNTTTFSVTGTDNNNCMASSVSTVTVNSLPNLSVTSATICEGQTATLTASGATYYNWNIGDTTSSIVVINPTFTTNYTVTGTNENGCRQSTISTVFISTINVVAQIVDVDCQNNTLGGISITPICGTPPYSYLWSTGETTQNINGLHPGMYELKIKDYNDNILKKQYIVYTCTKWTDLNNVDQISNVLTTNLTSPNIASSAKSKNLLYENKGGAIKYVVENTNQNFLLGLSFEENYTGGIPDVFAFEKDGSALKLYLKGIYINTYTGITQGDIIELVQDVSKVQLFKNGVVLFSVDSLNNKALKVDFFSIQNNISVSNVKCSFDLPKSYLNTTLIKNAIPELNNINVNVFLNNTLQRSFVAGEIEELILPEDFIDTALYFKFIFSKSGMRNTTLLSTTSKYGAIGSVKYYNDSTLTYDNLNTSLYSIRNKREFILIPIGKNINEISMSSFPFYLNLEGGLVLSPNSDGNYDVLHLVGGEFIENFEITIYDLSNTEVFHSTQPDFSWNGRNYSSNLIKGTYKYSMIVDSKTVNGTFIIDF